MPLELETSGLEDYFEWRIPGFPLVCLHFQKVKFKYDGREYCGVVKQEDNITIGTIRCSKNHVIVWEEQAYTVLWEPQLVQIRMENGAAAAVNDLNVRNEKLEAIHTSLFKVLGVCHHVERQKVLEQAYEFMYEYNRPVFAKLEKEPDNLYDQNAIGVYIMTDDEYCRAGYIASELTQHVHPHLNEHDFDVSIEKITFCTKFLRVGFYLTISLSKKGPWHKDVVNASTKVK